mmetsp:Transcript_14729/g.21534  ORF Transcript_14729/g.21534 Transcript_14729/m.21534 type:complete len:305 (+) Transcript_14729:86-1000(+)
MSHGADQNAVIVKAVQDNLSESKQEIHGSDSNGKKYKTITAMWLSQGVLQKASSSKRSNSEDEIKNDEVGLCKSGRREWYSKSRDYWDDEDTCPATVNGMLGGFASISNIDLAASKQFLLDLASIRPALTFQSKEYTTCAVECGAGIGRVTKGLLLPLGLGRCDLVESSSRLLSQAPSYIGDAPSSQCRFLCVGLQDFEPKENTYDIIWIQWVIGYLTDADCVDLFRRCGSSLRQPGGVICIKDNTCTEEAFILDVDDASVTRSLPYLLNLTKQAGLKVVFQRMQEDFPEDIFPVPMIALDVDR